jgi:seryl-tRNA synthetase
MIDIKHLRENPELYKKNNLRKAKDKSLIDSVLRLDEKWRKVKLEADNLRAERNKVSNAINEAKKSGGDVKSLIHKAQEIPKKLKDLESQEEVIAKQLNKELKNIPNLMHPSVPKGNSDKDNKVIRKVGKPTKFSSGFKVKNHVELLEAADLVDFDASAKTSGNGFYYLKGDLALLNRAIINFGIDFMKKKGYTYVEPPLMINHKTMAAATDWATFGDAHYGFKEEDLLLIPTSEHALLGLLTGQTVLDASLPLKFFAYSMCFRKEIGSHGINEKGLWRTHQFNKIEQFIFCHPEESWKLYDELMKNSEEIIKALKLPYRVIEICTADLGDWKARSHDIEVWRPTTKDYGEVGSLSNCTDYQARGLNIRGVGKRGERYVLHTLNNTAIATSRIMVAIVENYQQKDGTIKVPAALVKYMDGKKVIGKAAKEKKKNKSKFRKKGPPIARPKAKKTAKSKKATTKRKTTKRKAAKKKK